VINAGRRLVLAEAELRGSSEQKLYAHGRASYMVERPA
jgi:acyl-coenzyme A thioesterase PaaI-like protein